MGMEKSVDFTIRSISVMITISSSKIYLVLTIPFRFIESNIHFQLNQTVKLLGSPNILIHDINYPQTTTIHAIKQGISCFFHSARILQKFSWKVEEIGNDGQIRRTITRTKEQSSDAYSIDFWPVGRCGEAASFLYNVVPTRLELSYWTRGRNDIFARKAERRI